MSDDSIMKWPLERMRPAVSRGEFSKQFFLLGYVEEGRCGLYKAPIKEERRRQVAKRRER